MTFVPFSSVVSAFSSSLLEAAGSSSCFAVSDLKVEIPVEVKLVGSQVMVELASSQNPIDPSILTKLSFSLGATCAPEAMPKPSPWSVIPSGTTEALYGLAAQTGSPWTCGKNGVVLTSADGGESLSPLPIPDPFRLHTVTITGNNVVIVAGELGAVYLFPPGSPKWIPIQPFSKGHINALWSSGPRVVAVGSAGTIFVSDSDGKAWKQAGSFTQHNLHAVWSSPEGILFAAGANGAVGMSKDTGLSWNAMPSPGNKHLFGGWAAAVERVYVAGESGKVFFWEGGAAWTPLPTGTTESLYALFGFAQTDLWAVGRNGAIVRSKDGKSFTPVPLGLTASLHAVTSLDQGKLAISGTGGLVGKLDISILDKQ